MEYLQHYRCTGATQQSHHQCYSCSGIITVTLAATSTHDAYENTWKCGELNFISPHPPEDKKKNLLKRFAVTHGTYYVIRLVRKSCITCTVITLLQLVHENLNNTTRTQPFVTILPKNSCRNTTSEQEYRLLPVETGLEWLLSQ